MNILTEQMRNWSSLVEGTGNVFALVNYYGAQGSDTEHYRSNYDSPSDAYAKDYPGGKFWHLFTMHGGNESEAYSAFELWLDESLSNDEAIVYKIATLDELVSEWNVPQEQITPKDIAMANKKRLSSKSIVEVVTRVFADDNRLDDKANNEMKRRFEGITGERAIF